MFLEQKAAVTIIIITEIHAPPKLLRYMTALGAYNIKSFTNEINQHRYAHAHTHTTQHTYTACAHMHT